MAHKAPGKHYREGISLIEIMDMFRDDATAEAWFTKIRWPDGPHCPYCGSVDILSGASHKTMPYRCREKECRKRFSVRTKSAMEASNIPYRKWAIAFYLFATNLKGVSSMKLHRDLKITQKSAWFMAHRLRESWQDRGSMFSGPVEADETFIGGKRKNMPKAKRAQPARRGGADKAVVAGVKDRASNRIAARAVPDTSGETLKGFVKENSAPDAMVYTDENVAYKGLPRHETVRHTKDEYVRGDVGTQGIESFWSMFKRGYHGTYHHMSPKHLQRYVNEFSGRHNARDADTADQMNGMAQGMVGKRLTYRDLVSD